MTIDITMVAAGGEYMESATVVAWNMAVGMPVKAGDVIVVVETAKAATEITAPSDGVLSEIMAPVGAEVTVGSVLGRISEAAPVRAAVSVSANEPQAPQASPAATPSVADRRVEPDRRRIFASPLARRVAREHGVDLASVTGSGPGGRIKRRDVERAPVHSGAQGVPTGGSAPFTGAREAHSSGSKHLDAEAPIVFLHGFGADGTVWRKVVAQLGGARRTVVLELPGHGRTPFRSINSLRDLALTILDELQASAIAKLHLVGHSLGGAVALELADLGVLDVRSLCLIAPAGLGPEINGDFLQGFLRASHEGSLTPWLRKLTADTRIQWQEYASAVLRQRAANPQLRESQEAIASTLFPDGTQAFDQRAALERVSKPMKIIWGLEDEIIPCSHAKMVPGTVALHRFRNVGHMPQLEAPDAVSWLVDELVRSAPYRPAPARQASAVSG